MVAKRSVVKPRLHAALLEIYGPNRMGMGRSARAFQIAPCHNELLGKPRLTIVSDGNPLRRLLLRSK